MNRHLLLFGLAFAACADPEERSTTWDYLHATIIEPNCATSNCHSEFASENTDSLTGPIDLSTPDVAYLSLADIDCGDPVDPDHPSFVTSILPGETEVDLLRLLHGEYADNGFDVATVYAQMPLDVPLPDGEIRLIKEWIDGGAQCQ